MALPQPLGGSAPALVRDARLRRAAFVSRVPASFFAMVLGLAGLGNAWRAAAPLWGLPAAIGEAVMAAAVATWLAVLVLYAAKWGWAREAALAEWRHPVQCCYAGLAPVATLLAAMAVRPYVEGLARALFVLGAATQVAFAAWRTGGLWSGGRDPLATTPVLYLPTVAGSFVLAATAAALGHETLGALSFGAGMFSWLALESVILHRLLVHEPLAASLLPTLGIQLAPPVVGCAAYLALTGGAPDRFALALLGYGLLLALVLVRLAPRLRAQPFAPSYWAFTFGVTALAVAPTRMAAHGAHDLAPLAAVLFVVANVVVGGVAAGTLVLVARGHLLPPTPLTIRPSPAPETRT
jgi:tellurite resistance protein